MSNRDGWALLAGAAAILMWATNASGNTAAVAADGYSFSLQPAATTYAETVYFTTYDGSPGVPLYDDHGTYVVFSSELYPVSLGSSTFVTDYLIADSIGIYEYGAIAMSLGAVDGDGDGMLDPLELANGGGFSFSGVTQPDWNAFDIYIGTTLSGTVSRSAGSRGGSYSGSYSNPGKTAGFSGVFSLSGASGSVDYVPGSPNLTWNLDLTDIYGITYQLTGTSTYQQNGTDQISIPAFTLTEVGSGATATTSPAILNRFGMTYRGVIQLDDGGPATSWPDYTHYRLEITDANDANLDGIPDLTSAPEPGQSALLMSGLGGLLLLSRFKAPRADKRAPTFPR